MTIRRGRTAIRHAAVASLAGAVAGLGLAAAPAAAATTPVQATVTVSLGGPAAKALSGERVRRSASGGARLSGRTLKLPVRRGAVSGSKTTIQHDGALVLRRGSRRVTLRSLRTTLARSSSISALVGSRRVTVFKVAGGTTSESSSTGSVTRRGAWVTLTRAGGRLLKSKLELRRAPSGRFGTATIRTVPGATTTTPATPATPGMPAPGQTPVSQAPTAPPTTVERPVTATEVSASSLQWHVRESFVKYLSAAEGATAIEGATPGAPTGEPPLVYDFGFVPGGGWWDGAAGTAELRFTGGVQFRYSGHGIDLRASAPQVVQTGAAEARVSFVVTDAAAGTPGRRADLVRLDLAAATRTPAAEGKGETVAQAPATLTADGAAVLAGFYPAGADFGWFTYSAVVP